MRRSLTLLTIFLVSSGILFAHPHIQKSLTAKLGDVEAQLVYYTSPANFDHIKNAQVGAFSTGYARLSLSGDLKVSGATIPAGEYTIGAIKNGEKDWTMCLLPGKLGYGEAADLSKVIKLESAYSDSEGSATHVTFDIAPGSGTMEGRATVEWHFGPLFLAGAITDKAQ